jgi:glycosyltransferase involved in cell wall biosynthesis
MLVGEPTWSIDFNCRDVRTVLRDRYELVIRYYYDLTEREIDAADLVVAQHWFILYQLAAYEDALLRNRHKLIVGLYGPAGIEGKRLPVALEYFRKFPRALFGVSEEMCAVLRENDLGKPIYYLPTGADTTLFYPRPRPRGRALRVGWAGSLTNAGSERRGLREYIEPAVKSLRGVKLVTAAREDRWRPHEEMPEFYRGIDVYVCASRAEGAPNPCLEAAASGNILVSTRVGVMPELIADGVNGFLVERSVEAIAARLRELRDDPPLRERMRGAMAETMRVWSWDVLAERYAEMFDETLAAIDEEERGRRRPVAVPARREDVPEPQQAGALPQVVALVSARDAAATIGACIEHFAREGVGVYVIDDGSSDETCAIASSFYGRGLVGLETLLPSTREEEIKRLGAGAVLAADKTRAFRVLERKEQLADQLGADWYLHLDAADRPLAPHEGQTLAHALAEVERRQFNAVNFVQDGVRPQTFPEHVVAWSRRPQRPLLRWSRGARVRFPGLRVAPWSFVLARHEPAARDAAEVRARAG